MTKSRKESFIELTTLPEKRAFQYASQIQKGALDAISTTGAQESIFGAVLSEEDGGLYFKNLEAGGSATNNILLPMLEAIDEMVKSTSDRFMEVVTQKLIDCEWDPAITDLLAASKLGEGQLNVVLDFLKEADLLILGIDNDADIELTKEDQERGKKLLNDLIEESKKMLRNPEDF